MVLRGAHLDAVGSMNDEDFISVPSATVGGMRMAKLRLSFERLHDALDLPDGVRITDIHCDFDLRGEVIVLVEGQGLPEYCPGASLAFVEAEYEMMPRSLRFRGWR